MDMKEFFNIKSNKLNVIDNSIGILAGIGAYHFLKNISTTSYRSSEYGAVALTGLSVLHIVGGVEAGDFVRKRSRSIRLDLTKGFPYGEFETDSDELEDYQTITLPSEDIANNIMETVEMSFKENGVVTVGDLYNFCGLSSSWRDVKKGWVDISDFRITKIKDNKFSINVPKAIEL